MQQGYQWKEDELLFSLYLYMYATYKYSNQMTLQQWAFENGLALFLYTHCTTPQMLTELH